jgi:hypothetical protein
MARGEGFGLRFRLITTNNTMLVLGFWDPGFAPDVGNDQMNKYARFSHELVSKTVTWFSFNSLCE